jgi:hypothetical protein
VSRPTKPVPLAATVAKVLLAVEKLTRAGHNQDDGYDYTRATDVFESIRAKLFAAGILILPDEAAPEYVQMPTNGGETLTECRLGVTYTITNGVESLPPLRCHGIGRKKDEKALYIAQTGAEKAFLKRVGLMAEYVDDPEFDGQEQSDSPAERHTPRADDKTVTHAQRRAFATACESSNKTGDEILHYLFSAHQVSNVGDLKRGKQFTEALRWAATPTGASSPKPQAAPALQGSLPLPRPAPSFEMRVQGKTETITPKTGSYAL